ncbi:ABC transporter substrate-binding protein [Nonomuraea jabiensis]|uniref:Multiple sugar transport system substrate-binding protein n=1 Tax=Nonomuraea jabiensis TaxID=882448 RepID=A0A7W9FXS6_9ACTN|nr:sugar ABC transporter substrate-binding protein [Nonomuraea jabiensis]MBB5773555.1 multiple sugar transport system substrate-binding protein [Nonomuraea jabiensis]
MPSPRRSLATLALTAGLIASASACGGSSSAADDDLLEVWNRASPASAEVTKKVLAAFTAKTGIKTKYVPVLDNWDGKVQEAVAARNLPDIIINDSGMLGTNVSQGLIGPVDRNQIAGQGELHERAWEQAKGYDGKYYAVPYSVQTVATLIRKDWREKVGAEVPKTWEDLVALAKAFQEKDPDGNGKADTYGMVVPASTERGYASWWASTYIWQSGGEFLTESGGKFTPAIDQPKSVEAVKWLQNLFCKDKLVIPGALTLVTKDAHPFFETGKAGIYLTGPYLFGRFDKSLGKDKYEVIPSPAGPAGATSMAEGENVYLMAGSKLQDQQKKLAEYLITPEAQKLGMAGNSDGAIVKLPVNKSVDVFTERQDDRWTAIKEIYEKDGKYFPNVPNWQPFRQKSAETLNKVFADCGTDVQAALTELAGGFKTELATQKVG